MNESKYECRRCDFVAADDDDRADHARAARHPLCIVCYRSLPDDRRQCCVRCEANAKADIHDIVEAVTLAPEIIEAGGYRGILVDLLAYASDGAIESPRQQLHPDDYVYLNSRGQRVPPEHPSDPWPVLAVLEGIERTWRLEFGHGPATNVATITSCAAYLSEWTGLAARSFRGFDDDAHTLKTLRLRLKHAEGTSDDPETGVKCLDCEDVKLVRAYRPPVLPVPDPRRSKNGQRGLEEEGKADTYECPACRRTYDWADYGKAVHHYAANIGGWVKIADGAAAVRRTPMQVWRWINDGKLTVACLLDKKDRRARVHIDALREVDEAHPRRGNTPSPMLDLSATAS